MLMATKSLAWLFFVLTLLNLPVYAFYSSGNLTEQANKNFAFSDYFAMFSLGNIGQSKNACAENNLSIEPDMILSCSYGNLATLSAFGISKIDDETCTAMGESETPLDFLDNTCFFQ